MPLAVRCQGSTAISDHEFLLGGGTASPGDIANVYIFDMDTDQYTQKASLPQAATCYSLQLFKGKMIWQ